MDLYFIAIPIESDLTQKIRALQNIFAEEYEASRQLRIPVHITLIPPFRAKQNEIATLKKILVEFSCVRETFQIVCSGFGYFRKDVIYVSVNPTDKLKSFRKNLMETIENSDTVRLPKMHERFNPHITLANRDLKQDQFEKAWPRFEKENFYAQFDLSEITLYKHDGKLWQTEFGFKLVD